MNTGLGGVGVEVADLLVYQDIQELVVIGGGVIGGGINIDPFAERNTGLLVQKTQVAALLLK